MYREFLKKYGWYYLPGAVFLVLFSRFRTMIPVALGEAIDLLSGTLDSGAPVYRKALQIVGLACLVFLTQAAWRFFVIGNARRMEIHLRKVYFSKLQRLPVSFFAQQRSGDLIAYAINDINAVRMMFGPMLVQIVNGLLTAGMSIADMAAGIDARMTLFALLPLPLTIAAILLLGKVIHRRSRKVQGLFAQLSGFVNESIMGVRIIKSFAREEDWAGDFNDASQQMKDANIRLNDISALINPVVTIAFAASYAVSLIVGGNLVQQNTITVGELVAFLSYLALIQMPIIQLGRITNIAQRGSASHKRLKAIIDTPSVPDSEFLPYDREIRGEIQVRNLTFTYPDGEHPELQDVSFHLPAGGTLGIAGTTGCGKTTLISLLLKLYDPPQGTIFIDGQDICDIPAQALRAATGYVAQDGFLFSTTIRENIRFYHGDDSDEAIRHAADIASIDREIMEFPQKYETQVGERGTHLSGGQKQRISLARALARDPAILILDDTLSAVDNITEKRITGHLSGILKDKTSIVISHRLSALKDADLILYMEDGRIVERGTHAQLLAQGGRYAETFAAQSHSGGDDHE